MTNQTARNTENSLEVLFFRSQASDIWSMGITVYAFVYGNVPFNDNNIIGLYSKIQNEPIHFPPQPEISEDLKDLIKQMLHKDPSLRLNLSQVKVKIRAWKYVKFHSGDLSNAENLTRFIYDYRSTRGSRVTVNIRCPVKKKIAR